LAFSSASPLLPSSASQPSNLMASSVANMEAMNIIIWGETGEGKSTLINTLVGSKVADAGRNPAGVTKHIKSYDAMVNGCLVRLFDLPGAGDKDVPAYRTMEGLAIAFKERKVDGLLLLSSRSDRMPLGSQLVAKMMDLSFTNEDKWASVVLVGTKNDRYDQDDFEGEVRNFKVEVLAEFNKTVGGDIKKVCTCNHKDIGEVISMIELLRKEKGMGNYQQPEAARVAATLCDLNGLPEGATRDQEMARIIEQMTEDRKRLQIALEQQEEENRRREQEHREMVDSMREDQRKQKEDMTELMEQTKRDAEEREKRLKEEIDKAKSSQPSNGGITIDLGGLLGPLIRKI